MAEWIFIGSYSLHAQLSSARCPVPADCNSGLLFRVDQSLACHPESRPREWPQVPWWRSPYTFLRTQGRSAPPVSLKNAKNPSLFSLLLLGQVCFWPLSCVDYCAARKRFWMRCGFVANHFANRPAAAFAILAWWLLTRQILWTRSGIDGARSLNQTGAIQLHFCLLYLYLLWIYRLPKQISTKRHAQLSPHTS